MLSIQSNNILTKTEVGSRSGYCCERPTMILFGRKPWDFGLEKHLNALSEVSWAITIGALKVVVLRL